MNINMFNKYKLKITNKYSYIADKEGYDYFFKDEEVISEKVIEGGELMEILGKDMMDSKTAEVSFHPGKDDNSFEIYLSQMNPLTGEGADILYEISPVKKEMEEKENENAQ